MLLYLLALSLLLLRLLYVCLLLSAVCLTDVALSAVFVSAAALLAVCLCNAALSAVFVFDVRLLLISLQAQTKIATKKLATTTHSNSSKVHAEQRLLLYRSPNILMVQRQGNYPGLMALWACSCLMRMKECFCTFAGHQLVLLSYH